jgi:hypothetical protein
MTPETTFPVAFRLGQEAAKKGPGRKTDFPANFPLWSDDRQVAFYAGFQTGMRKWPITTASSGGRRPS